MYKAIKSLNQRDNLVQIPKIINNTIIWEEIQISLMVARTILYQLQLASINSQEVIP